LEAAVRFINFETIKNFYESYVYEQISRNYGESELAEQPGALEDIACLALNQLPPRYVRHSIDTAFYLTIEEKQEMIRAVELAVDRAASYVRQHPRLPLVEQLPNEIN
jgi:competence protein ComFB